MSWAKGFIVPRVTNFSSLAGFRPGEQTPGQPPGSLSLSTFNSWWVGSVHLALSRGSHAPRLLMGLPLPSGQRIMKALSKAQGGQPLFRLFALETLHPLPYLSRKSAQIITPKILFTANMKFIT